MFQSTRPVRDATVAMLFAIGFTGVSIHASRAGRDLLIMIYLQVLFVSIHASRAGRDNFYLFLTYFTFVSIHASRAGRDFPRE